MSVEEFKQFNDVISDDVYPCLQLENIIARRNIKGGTAPAQTASELTLWNERLAAR